METIDNPAAGPDLDPEYLAGLPDNLRALTEGDDVDSADLPALIEGFGARAAQRYTDAEDELLDAVLAFMAETDRAVELTDWLAEGDEIDQALAAGMRHYYVRTDMLCRWVATLHAAAERAG